MTGFKEHFKNEKRAKTLNFIKNIFGSIFSTKAWYFIFFWIFLISSIYMLYASLTFKNKFPVECGTIQSFEIGYNSNGEDTISYHIFIKTNNSLEDLRVDKMVYKKYDALYKTNPNIQYCESYVDKTYIFYCIMIGVLLLFAIIFIISYNNAW